jgi:ABC-2 type transport system permease protein
MLLLGSYFNSVQDSMAWTYFGYVLGSLLGYWLSEILIHKSVHVFKLKAARGYVIFGLAMVLVIGAVNCDFTGYEQKMPPLAQVESVYWDNSFYQLTKTIPANSSISVYAENPDDAYQREVSMIYTQPDSVANIYALHKAIIANGQRDESLAQPSKNDSRQNFSFAYTLKNGDTLYRQYSIPVEQYRSQLKPVYESQERKLKVNDVLHITPAQVDLVTVSANEVNRSIKITDPAKIKEAILAIQNDVRAQTYEEITSNRVPWAQISLLLSNEKYIRLDWSKSYAEFSGWLAGNGYNARVQAADIKYVLVEKAPAEASNPEMEKYRGQFPAEYLADLEQRGNYIKITDPQQIEVCLNNYSYKDRGQTYNVVFVMKDGNSFSGSFNEESKPDFIE